MKFRQFLELLKEEKELVTSQEQVSWNLEAAVLGAKSLELDSPALLFENISGYGGFSLVSGINASGTDMYNRLRFPWIRQALALDQLKDFPYTEMQQYFDDALSQGGIKPLELSRAGWDKHVEDENVDLNEIPFPIIHEGDGGRYSNMNVVIVEDPEVGTISWTNERFMVVSKDTIALKLIEDSPLTAIYNKYQKLGKPMPFSIAIGVDSTIPIAVAIYAENITMGMPAADLAGYLSGEPIELTKSTKSKLLVPANAELVLEGVAMPGETAVEGPFIGMIRLEAKSQQPLLHLTAVSHRNNPIIPFDVTGIKRSDSMTLKSYAHSFKLMKLLGVIWGGFRAAKWVYCPVSMRLGMCIVSCDAVFPGFEFFVSRALMSSSHWYDKVMIVDTGCDPEELARIMGDMFIKASPVKDFHFSQFDNAALTHTAKYPIEGDATGRMYVNCTFDPTWSKDLLPIRVSFETTWPVDMQDKIISNWKKWGFTKEPHKRRIRF